MLARASYLLEQLQHPISWVDHERASLQKMLRQIDDMRDMVQLVDVRLREAIVRMAQSASAVEARRRGRAHTRAF